LGREKHAQNTPHPLMIEKLPKRIYYDPGSPDP
jgi:hypothetical protein